MEISGATMTFGWEGSQSLDCERLVRFVEEPSPPH
jgi:hypothetical protein